MKGKLEKRREERRGEERRGEERERRGEERKFGNIKDTMTRQRKNGDNILK